MTNKAHVGVVIIGRNEGNRLVSCLNSLIAQSTMLIYVDSASTDDSIKNALAVGADVVTLDMGLPFTAARARNEGFKRMRELYPETNYVQFVDGDCEIATEWIEKASSFLDLHQEIAVVCGRLHERYPERSIYNMLCDMEWNIPAGESKACGGNAMIRVDAFEFIHGFQPNLIAGEEPELCVRLRMSGWKIWRLNHEMALHDAAMTRFGQWWKRSTRGGYAFAEGAYLHGSTTERHWVKESRRSLLWGLLIPLVTISFTFFLGAWALILLLIYPIQVIRIALSGSRSARENWLQALFLVLGKFAETLGQFKFLYNKLIRKSARLMEYK